MTSSELPAHHDLISVIIPTYNRSSLVVGAINSVFAQTHPQVEIIVVDDGSTDDTATVLADISGIRVLHQENQGQGAARQAGLNHAKGAYIATLDSDDRWQPEFLSESLKILRQADATFVFSDWITLTPEGDLILEDALAPLTYLHDEPHQKIKDWNLLSVESTRRVFTRHCPTPSSSFLVDRRFISKGWHQNLSIADDWAFLLEIILSHPDATCAYSSVKLWTKQIDGSNICDGHTDPIRLAKKYISDHYIMISIFGDRLDSDEIRFLKSQVARSFRDLAHFQSITEGSRRLAIGNAIKSLRLKPSLANCKLLGKCLVRALFGLRS